MTIASIKLPAFWGSQTIDNIIEDENSIVQTLDNNLLDENGTLILIFQDLLQIVPSVGSRQVFLTLTDNRKFIVIATKDDELTCQPLDEFCAIKDPGETLDYTIDYSAIMNASEPPDSIASSTWMLELTGTESSLALTGSSGYNGTTATVWISGGNRTGLKHRLINHIICASGRHYERTITIWIKSK